LTLRHGEASGQVLIDKVVSAVRAFSGREQFDDDICLLTVESTGMTCPVYAPNWEI
jgi:serine phosphatase RsbU (regulator of sigma subunit)